MDNPEVPQTPPPSGPLLQFTQPSAKTFVPPTSGEVITSLLTHNTYTIGDKIGDGHFGIVYSCNDVWGNDLAVKVLKPLVLPYEKIRASAEAEFAKLVALRHPNITYIYDAFEYRDTFYIITERCFCPASRLFSIKNFDGKIWLMPIARCLLQAIHFLHINNLVHQDIHPGNVFTAFVKDDMPSDAKAIQFKVADLGVAKFFHEVDAKNTRAQWMLPPEVVRPEEFGPVDYNTDLYHVGLFLLQLALSKEATFTLEEVLAGKPRQLAETLPPPLNFALEKALRRHAPYRTSSAMELWRDLRASPPTALLELQTPCTPQ